MISAVAQLFGTPRSYSPHRPRVEEWACPTNQAAGRTANSRMHSLALPRKDRRSAERHTGTLLGAQSECSDPSKDIEGLGDLGPAETALARY